MAATRHFLLNLRREERSLSGKPAGVAIRDGIPTLTLDPPLFAELPPRQQEALLEHLVKHLVHLHLLRRKERNGHDWDIACDLAINPTLGELPEGAPYPARYGLEDGLAAEEYYRLLVPPFDIGNLEGSGFGDAGAALRGAAGAGTDSVPGETWDDHEIWGDADSTPFALGEEMVRSLTRESLRMSEGVAPGELRAAVDNLLRPSPVPWPEVLRQFVACAGRVGRKSSWLREHRRFGHDTPGMIEIRLEV